MDNLDKEKVKRLIQNLKILDFPVQAMQENDVHLHEDMFAKPNSKVFQEISHFLFLKFNETQANELFRSCYPCYNKNRVQVFHTTCMNWWRRIAEENSLYKIPKVTHTLMKSPTGPVVIQLLFSFSLLVMYQESVRFNDGEELGLLPPISSMKCLQPMQINGLKSASHSECVEYIHNLQISKYADEKAQKEADLLVQDYRKKVKQKKELAKKRDNLDRELGEFPSRKKYSSALGTPNRSSGNRELTTQIDKSIASLLGNVRRMWKKLLNFVEESSDQREIIESVLESNPANCLNASDLATKVSSTLLQQKCSEVYKRVGPSLYEAGQLNLIGLVSLLNLSLQLVIEKLHEVGVPNFESKLPFVNTQSEIQGRNVAALNEVCDTIQQMLPETEKTLKELEKSVDELYEAKPPISVSAIPQPEFLETHETVEEAKTLGILPPTPPLKFSPQKDDHPSPLHQKSSPTSRDELSKFLVKCQTPLRHLNEAPHVSVETTTSQPSTVEIPNLSQGKLEDTSLSLAQKAVRPKTKRALKATASPNISRLKKPSNFAGSKLSSEKSSSLPCTPSSNKSETKIEKITSRTPEAVRKLIDQIVGYTMTEMEPRRPSHESITPGSAIPSPFRDPISQLEKCLKENIEPEMASARKSTKSKSEKEDDEEVFGASLGPAGIALWNTSFPSLGESSTNDEDFVRNDSDTVNDDVPVGNLIDL